MSDKENDNNIIDLKRRQKSEDEEFSETEEAWETHIDLSLQEHSDYIQSIIAHNRMLTDEIEDLSRDYKDLKRTVDRLVDIIVKQHKGNINE